MKKPTRRDLRVRDTDCRQADSCDHMSKADCGWRYMIAEGQPE